MKKLLPTILILIFGCDTRPKTDTLTGDLYFSFFKLGNYYNQPDSVVNQSKLYFDTVTIEKLNTGEKRLLRQYRILKQKNLLYRPFVYLRVKDDSVVTLYLDTLDYDRIKIYRRQKLQDENKKVRIEASVIMIDSGLFNCVKLKRVDLVYGETLQRQRKFKIDDYD
ncbi:MAG: hypothetical protein ACK5R0_09905 [Bacteroidota bacterium]|jgi:hypothetical protein